MARKTLIAITEIHMGVEPGRNANPATGEPRKKPKTKIIPAKARFMALSEEQEKELIGMGAAREVGEGDQVEGTVVDAKKIEATGGEVVGQAGVEPTASTGEQELTEEEQLEAARARYEELFDQKPGNMKLETLQKHIAEKEAEDGDGEGEDDSANIV